MLIADRADMYRLRRSLVSNAPRCVRSDIKTRLRAMAYRAARMNGETSQIEVA
jgi:hypothetical protein